MDPINMVMLCHKASTLNCHLLIPYFSFSVLPLSIWGAQPYIGRTLSGLSEFARCVAAYAQDIPRQASDVSMICETLWNEGASWTAEPTFRGQNAECSHSMLVVESYITLVHRFTSPVAGLDAGAQLGARPIPGADLAVSQTWGQHSVPMGT